MENYAAKSLVDVCGTVEQLRQRALEQLHDVAMPFSVQEYEYQVVQAKKDGGTLTETKDGEECWLFKGGGERPISQPEKRLYLVIGSSFARSINKTTPKLIFERQNPCHVLFECMAGSGELQVLELLANHPAAQAIASAFPGQASYYNYRIQHTKTGMEFYTSRRELVEEMDAVLIKAGLQISALNMEQDLVELTRQNLRARI